MTTSGDIRSKASNNTGAVVLVSADVGEGTQGATPYFFAGDDRQLVFREQGHPETGDNIGVIPVETGSDPQWLLASEFNERNAGLSPNERWITYQSDESGQYEIYVRPFPNVEDGLWIVSTAGGIKPLWSPDGAELFYLEPGTPTRMMAVPVQTEGEFEHESPREVIEWPYDWGNEGRTFDYSVQDHRFLVVKPLTIGDATVQVDVVLNWTDELKRLVPVD